MKMKDIATNLGLSIATVSRVVNNQPNVSQTTKDKVLKYIKEQEYTPNAIAQSLSRKESKTIALLVPNITNPFFGSMIDIIIKTFIKTGYQISLYNTVGDKKLEEKAIKTIVGQKVAGVIAILNDGKYEDNPLKILIQKEIPVYLIDRDIEESKLSGVFINNFSGAYKLTNKLIKKGHKNIGIITGNLNFLNARERLRGFLKALEDNNIEYDEKNIYKGNYLVDSGEKLAPSILKNDNTALFVSNNLMLYGFLKKYKNSNKKLEFACFEKTEFLDILDIEVMTCEISLEEMAQKIYELFINKKKNKKIYIEPKLYDERSKI